MKKIISGFVLLFSVCLNAAGNPIVNVPPGARTFQITLPENPTTGYQWTAKYDTKLLTLSSSPYTASQKGMIGSGGQKIFNFKLVKGVKVPKTTEIEFSMARPWEHKNVSVQKVTVQFKQEAL